MFLKQGNVTTFKPTSRRTRVLNFPTSQCSREVLKRIVGSQCRDVGIQRRDIQVSFFFFPFFLNFVMLRTNFATWQRGLIHF